MIVKIDKVRQALFAYVMLAERQDSHPPEPLNPVGFLLLAAGTFLFKCHNSLPPLISQVPPIQSITS